MVRLVGICTTVFVALLSVATAVAQPFPIRAGLGTPGFSGDGGPATKAKLSVPSGVFLDIDGNIVIADTSNDRLRVVGADGTIRTISGTGDRETTGDGGPAIDASLNSPTAVFVDGGGNIYVAEWTGHRIRKISPSGTITTVLGTGSHGYNGDGKQGTETNIWSPSAIFIDGDRNLYVAEWDNHRIRKMTADGVVSTIAGTGFFGTAADGTVATKARIHHPNGIFVTEDGSVYFSEMGSQLVRRIKPDGTLETIAGTGSPDDDGDGGPGTQADVNNPAGLFLDTAGNLYIADSGNGSIRRVTPGGTIDTVIGGNLFGNDDSDDPTELSLHRPNDLFVTTDGGILVAEGSGHQVRFFPLLAEPTELAGSLPKTSDFDGDAVVGFTDFLLFVDQFGLSSDDPGFDARFDLFEDGTVGFADFLRFARAFGSSGQ